MPAGMRTLSRLRVFVYPVPPHDGHLCATFIPVPPQSGQREVRLTIPNGVRWLLTTSPLPPQVLQVTGFSPSLPPVPRQARHSSL